MNISTIKLVIFNVLIFFFICQLYAVKQSCAVENKQFKDAQALVEKTVAHYPQIVRLTIHAIPTGEKTSRIIACNVRKKIGKLSGPEDLEAIKNSKTTALKEGNNLDVTTPIYDRAGNSIAATGITLCYKKGEDENTVLEKAKSIARELNDAIQKAGISLW